MTAKDTFKITCPQCQHQFNAEESLRHQMEHQMAAEKASFFKQFESEKKEVADRKVALAELEANLNQKAEKMARQKIRVLRDEVSEEIREQFSDQIARMKEDQEKSREELAKMRDLEIKLEKVQRDKDEMEQAMELKYQRQLTDEMKEKEEKLRQQAEEAQEMRMREMQKQLEDTRQQLQEANRKANQQSMQLQGEVQELAIEEYLQRAFPIDEVKEVPKGISGADCLLLVKDNFNQPAGRIIIESKRTKRFSESWIGKLNEDQLKAKAALAILVTEALPDENKKMDIIDGVWVCDFHTFKLIIAAARVQILEVHTTLASQKNKGDKMNLLYNYLTSQEFQQQMKAIVESWQELLLLEHKERATMERIWKNRHKILEKVHINTNNFIGSIQGIAGQGMLQLAELEEPVRIEE